MTATLTRPVPTATVPPISPGRRAGALADRLTQGARALEAVAHTLTPADWHARLPRDGRPIGVVVHHVAAMYPVEIQLARLLAAGRPIVDLTWDVIHKLNAEHAATHERVTRDEALDLLRRNSAAAADAIRALTDEELDGAAAVSLNDGAPLTCQFFLEDHAVRHSFHHLARIRAALTAWRTA